MPVSSLNARALATLPAKFATTVMPLLLSASQIALPMPRVPPVTIATRVISCPIGLLLIRSLVGQQGPSRQRKTPPRRGFASTLGHRLRSGTAFRRRPPGCPAASAPPRGRDDRAPASSERPR